MKLDLLAFRKKHTPRWIILSIDIFISIISIVFAYLLRFNFDYEHIDIQEIDKVIIFILIIRLILFISSRSYSGIIRHTGTRDAVKIIFVILLGNSMYAAGNLLGNYFMEKHIIPFSVILIDFFISIFLMTAFRLIVKGLYIEANNYFKKEKTVIILGMNEDALTVKGVLMRDFNTKYKIVAFLDPYDLNPKKQLDRVIVYKSKDLDKILEKNGVSDLIIADGDIPAYKKQEIIDICFNYNINVLTIPKVSEWINGELSYNQIRKINIEDLLERPPIKLDVKQIKKDITNKVILVTGAAGSIGREIIIQLTKFYPKKIIIIDQAESPMYDLELELKEKLNYHKFEVAIGDISNIDRINNIFEKYRPEIIYHAAAYKHVPMMENNPSEAVTTNVLGTKIIADTAIKYNAIKFVMVSTDKAVNPTNVMGASKRIAEIYTQTLSLKSDTKFITTRFGNVLGSNGSVIPRFRQQIEEGGPVTVTHPEVTRYFMTIPEACQLVLQAGTLGEGGEIFIFDMGKSVKIIDLAKKMIKLSGLQLGKDINLNITGLRPGEKLYEELLNDKENTLPTKHAKIMVAKVRKYDPSKIIPEIDKLISFAKTKDNFEIVKQMKNMVPEFTSKNSVYEMLD